jgi:biopolymer transport protein ExbD
MSNLPQYEEVKMDLTPMIDVTFLLMIFFIVTLKFRVLEGRLDASLPKDMGTQTFQVDPIEKVNVIMLVSEPGELVDDEKWKGLQVYQGREVRYEVGTHVFRTVKELEDALTPYDKKEQPVTIDPRKGIINEDVMVVLDVILRLQFSQVSFSGSYEQEG